MPETQHTIASAIQWGQEQLKNSSESPMLDCEVLLAHSLNSSRSHLFAWPDKKISDEIWQCYSANIGRRRTRFPVAYLTGHREFWSRDFVVTPDVLIPRPDTELLIEVTLEILSQYNSPIKLADLGTGSGAIAITLALENKNSDVIAIDRSFAALNIAKKNATTHQANVAFICGSWMDSFPNHSLDVIVSNPPYIASNDPHLTDSEISHEPTSALASGCDGLNDIRVICSQAQQKLKPAGILILEHGFEQHEEVSKILESQGFSEIRTYRDLQNHPRVTLGTMKLAPSN